MRYKSAVTQVIPETQSFYLLFGLLVSLDGERKTNFSTDRQRTELLPYSQFTTLVLRSFDHFIMFLSNTCNFFPGGAGNM